MKINHSLITSQYIYALSHHAVHFSVTQSYISIICQYSWEKQRKKIKQRETNNKQINHNHLAKLLDKKFPLSSNDYLKAWLYKLQAKFLCFQQRKTVLTLMEKVIPGNFN